VAPPINILKASSSCPSPKFSTTTDPFPWLVAVGLRWIDGMACRMKLVIFALRWRHGW
jgi:hypothetical protein